MNSYFSGLVKNSAYECKTFEAYLTCFANTTSAIIIMNIFEHLNKQITCPNLMLNTVIFDMDGLLIDSEPLWEEAGKETLQQFNIKLTPEQYHSSTGLRSSEWIEHWFGHFGISMIHAAEAERNIVRTAIEKIVLKAAPMPRVQYTFNHLQNFFLAASHIRKCFLIVLNSCNHRLHNVFVLKILLTA